MYRYASTPRPTVIAVDRKAYHIDLSVSFSKQCFGITLRASAIVGYCDGGMLLSALPCSPLYSCPSGAGDGAAGAAAATFTRGGSAEQTTRDDACGE